MYAMLLARFKMFPEVKEKGMSSVPRLVAFTSEHVGICVLIQLYDQYMSNWITDLPLLCRNDYTFFLHISCGSVCDFNDNFHTTNADIKPTLCVSYAEGHEVTAFILKGRLKDSMWEGEKKRPLDITQTFQ